MKDARIVAMALLAWVACLPHAYAKTNYVNNVTGNDGYDGLAAVYDGVHGPKFKIQSAIDAAVAGDTVMVAPGVYGDEQGSVPSSTAGSTVRVYIDKSITLISSGGRDNTFIVGKRGDDATYGFGTGGVTGLQVASTVATGADDPVEIIGFTFRNCYSDAADYKTPGGVVGWRASSVPVLADGTGPWVVDCMISNCAYKASGALGRVNAARTCVKDNYSNSVGVNAYQCNLVHCALAGYSGQVGIIGTASQYAINCTFTDGSHNPCSSSCVMYFLNTVFTALNNSSVYCTAVTNCVMPGEAANGDSSDASNLKGDNYNISQIAAPLFGDFRPLVAVAGLCSSASLLGRGDPKWLALVPEKYRYVDMEGTAFAPDGNGKIAVGAVQTAMTPVAGFTTGITVIDGANTASTCINGLKGKGGGSTARYATRTFLDAVSWPRCYEITAKLPEGKHLWAFSSDDAEGNRFPTKDGRILFVPAKGRFTSVSAVVATKVYYVDDENGNDNDYDGLSAAVDGSTGPFATIQKAIDTVGGGFYANIYVAPGLYNKGAREYDSGVRPKCRVAAPLSSCKLRIVSTGTAEETIIAGEADTTSESRDSYGNGPEAVRCIRFHSGSACCLQGFTLTGGHTDSTAHTSTVSWRGGGAFISETKSCWLMDCIVSNNFSAASGAAMYGGSAARCRFMDNRVEDTSMPTFFSEVRLSGCTIKTEGADGDCTMATDTKAVNCSSYCSAAAKIFNTGVHGYLFNNVVCNNAAMGNKVSAKCAAGNILDGTTYTDAGVNSRGPSYEYGSAYYVDAPNGDLRISSGSAAIGAGTAWTQLAGGGRLNVNVAWTNYYALIQHDFDGNGPCFVNGNPSAGAYQKPAKYLVLAPGNRASGFSVSVPVTNMVDFGESITISASDGRRKVLGLEVDGEFTAAMSHTVVAPPSIDKGMTTVKILANTNWYVDAVNGIDGRTGWTEETAMHTLSNAMDIAESGDVVVALPGTYSEGSMLQTNVAISVTPALPSRVVVPEGVSLVSRDGAETTIIKGEHANTTTGHGEGSMRCVYLQNKARLSGFTVTGGATLGTNTSATDDNSGAGIFCAEAASWSPTTLVTDCIISNNVANAGGGGAYRGCIVARCRFFNNGSCNEGGALANCCVYECLFDCNYGVYGVSQPYDIRGCTFGKTTKNWLKTADKCALRTDPNSAVWNVRNCLFLGGAKCPIRHIYNCIVPSADFIYTEKTSSNWVDIVVAEVQVDEKYAPAYDSAAANAANMGYATALELEGDVYGNPRRLNGGMDMGAVEKDWRPRYAADLGRQVSVTEASWDVTETARKGVAIPDGASLTAEWAFGAPPRRGKPSIRFVVGAGATFTIVRAGHEPVVFGPGAGEYRFADMDALETFAFSASGGCVELLGFNRNRSLVMSMR
ncbi:MAG: hypothetical protein IKO72_03135 [Kiritimatiellae bacterium]|nr:hypothetical protein [Kiritimatiellia bacterium]